MMLTHLSPQLATKVSELVDNIGNASEVINVWAVFSSPSQPSFNVTMSKNIKNIKIEQQFILNYADKITMTCEVPKNTYIVLYNSRKDLQCLLEFTAFDPTVASFIPEKPYFSRKFRAILMTNPDIFKQFPADRLEPSERSEKDTDRTYFKVEIELVSDVVFQMRKRRVNFMATTATMKNILEYTANVFGIKKAVISPPDNTTVYTNFYVPPSMGMCEVMNYYQKAPGYGVYTHGFCYYITDDVLFIFPRFGRPIDLNLIDIYYIGQKNFEGLNKFSHQSEYSKWYKWFSNSGSGAGKYEILCNTDVIEKNWSDLGSENDPTAYNTQMDQTLIDGMKINKADELYSVVANVINYVVKPSDPVSTSTINIQFRRNHGNPYSLQSELFRFQGTSLCFDWKNARPFTFLPGTTVKYHYDDKFGYACLNCTCEAVTYEIQQLDNPLMPSFGCNATVLLNHMNQII